MIFNSSIAFKKIYRLFIFSIFLPVFFYGCASVPSGGYTYSAKEIDIKDICHRFNVHWDLDSINQVVVLTKNGKEARLLLGSRTAVVNGQRVTLNEAIKRKRGSIVVPSDFKSKIIDRLREEAQTALIRYLHIVIDPGHGGKDPGAVSQRGLYEKTINLDISKRLEKILKKEGMQVTLTRIDDVFITLEERAAIAHKAKADLFISIHANANPSKRIKGFETYYLRRLDGQTLKEVFQSQPVEELLKSKNIKRHSIVDEIVFDMLYQHKQKESARLAQYITDQTTRKLDVENRGCKMAGYSVLRHTLIPAVLIEVGYLSNRSEEKLLSQEHYRQQLAEQIAASITSYGWL